MRFCIDCKWHVSTLDNYCQLVHMCGCPSRGKFNLITGEESMPLCESERFSGAPGVCGVVGKFWEAKVL